MSEAPKKSLKESLELIEALKLLGVAGVEISKDGIGQEDIVHALNPLKDAGKLVEGFKGLGEVGDELKDLDDQELIQLGAAAYSVYKDIRAALKKEVVA